MLKKAGYYQHCRTLFSSTRPGKAKTKITIKSDSKALKLHKGPGIEDGRVSIYELTAQAASSVFSDGFEDGLLESMWFWDSHNRGGLKEVTSDNPHSGQNCLFMKGADWEPGGCSGITTVPLFSLESARITLWVRDIVLKKGGGGDGSVRVTLFDEFDNQIGHAFEKAADAADGTWSWMLKGESWSDAKTTNVSLRSLSGWVRLDILYRSGSKTFVSLLVNGNTVLAREYNENLGSVSSVQLLAAGQYYNTGEWYVDDVSISQYGGDQSGALGIVYQEDFNGSDPNFSVMNLDPYPGDFIGWDSGGGYYKLKTYDSSHARKAKIALSPTFASVGGSFRLEFDLRPVQTSWGHVPNLIFADSSFFDIEMDNISPHCVS